MNARRTLVMVSLFALVTAGSVTSCRQDEPASDPKTPANSPFPRIEKKDDDTKPSPKLPSFGGDAG